MNTPHQNVIMCSLFCFFDYRTELLKNAKRKGESWHFHRFQRTVRIDWTLTRQFFKAVSENCAQRNP